MKFELFKAGANAVKIRRILLGGGSYELKLDRQDLGFYIQHTWKRGPQGLHRFVGPADARKWISFQRALLDVQDPDLFVQFRNKDQYDLRRSNLILARRGCHSAGVPKIRTVTKAGGLPCGIFLGTVRRRRAGVEIESTRIVTGFRFKRTLGIDKLRGFSVEKYGFHEAARRALDWRIGMFREYGLRPPKAMLDALERVTRMARAVGVHEDLYGGNAEYENTKVVAREVAHWAQPWEEAT